MVKDWNADAPRPEGHRPGDPGRQDLRGGHRRGDHRRQRALPGVQHQPGRRAPVPEAGRPGRARRASTAPPTTSRRAPETSADQYKSPDGKFYQIPWKSEPGDDLLQQGPLQEGRPRPGEPAAGDLRRVPRRPARRSSTAAPPRPRSGRRRRASSSSPGSTSTRCTPRRPAASSSSRTARRPSTTRTARTSANFWAQMYKNGYSPKETYNGDSFADKKAAMAIVGPWAIAVYRARSTGAWSRCRPRTAWPRARSTRSPTPRTSASTPPARTRRPPGTC